MEEYTLDIHAEKEKFSKTVEGYLLQINYVCNAHKPFKKGYARAMAVLRTKPEETAMIGDQLFTDMWGGNRWGLYTILLEPMAKKEYWFTTNFSRRLEKLVRKKIMLP